MIDESRRQGDRPAPRWRDAGLPPAALGRYPDLLFDRTIPVVTDHLRALALSALRSLLACVAERLLYDIEDFGKSLDISRALDRMLGSPGVRDAELSAALVQRAEEHLVAERLANLDEIAFDLDAAISGPMLARLAEYEDAQVRSPVLTFSRLMELRCGEEPRLLMDELPAALAERLYWLLSAELARGQDTATVRMICGAVERLIAERDIVRSAQHAAVMLMQRLEEREELTDGFVLRLVAEGEVLLAVAALAVRGRVSTGTAWVLLLRGEPDVQAAYLAATGFGNQAGARIIALLRWAGGRDEDYRQAVRGAKDAFDRLDRDDANASLEWWRLNREFRLAHAQMVRNAD
ncbi:hypothetical protein B5C34_11460 [Pacificimonas flava]|uniref:DUF2336 domain-containing protein n=2 Tax=Pacificimonas TaxID=1960290 RepID=A0A219B7D2_9SPHN|nr:MULTISPECIES: DUF2336 domain-containing protein [Pacificimonas]MBZ6378715.1 DUF2336 domain-containing protein [Pacificimonas aurantium]OWV34016.1 hypothetical protein B5C34_11460 [Pacificimonas flava]